MSTIVEGEEKKEVRAKWWTPCLGAAALTHPSTIGDVKVSGTKGNIINDLMIHVRQNYIKYDEEQVMKRF